MVSLQDRLYGNNKIPLYLNSHIRQHYITILKDQLTIEYTGKSRYCDPGSVQSNISVPINCPLYYFEVEIIKCDTQPKIVIGFTYKNYHLNKHPGSEPNSIGYKSEDGLRMNGTSKSENYGPSYGKGDVIGCGINYMKQNYFYTKNGVFLGNAGQLFHIDHYPTVGLSTYGESVVFNFIGPFKFDIEDYFKNIFITEREDINNQIVSSSVMDNLIKYYLLQRGYQRTLEVFDKESATEIVNGMLNDLEFLMIQGAEDENKLMDKDFIPEYYISDNVLGNMNSTLQIRSDIFNNISSGNILAAIDLIESNYDTFDKSSLAYVMLITQHFIEMLRLKNDDIKALEWLKEQFSLYNDTFDDETKGVIREVCGIIAYKDHENCVLSHIFNIDRRLQTAILVNDKILCKWVMIIFQHHSAMNNSNIASLKTIVQYLVLGRKLLKNVNGNTGPVYSAHDFCQPLMKFDT